MSGLIDIFEKETKCTYKDNVYSVRDNGSVMRYPQEGKKPRPLDNKWTFGTINKQKKYAMIGSEPVHRIVATAFLGEAPSKNHVVDHIDTNRQNNRPENLRWVTRLENIVLNEFTRKKLESLCGCTIDEILSDLSILRNKNIEPQFEWMRAVSKEEAEQSLATWKKWVSEVKERKEYDKVSTQYFKYRNGPNAMVYPLEPIGGELSLQSYFDNLKVNETFCYKDYNSGRATYKILDYFLNEKTGVLSVATTSSSGIKSLYLTSITLVDNEYLYDTKSFFSPDGLEKYMTIAKGEEWKGGEVFDDFC